jgi:hypothetical protein
VSTGEARLSPLALGIRASAPARWTIGRMKSREEQLTWAKQRALICVDMGRFADAVAGLRADSTRAPCPASTQCAIQSADGRGARPEFASADRLDRELQVTHCTRLSSLSRRAPSRLRHRMIMRGKSGNNSRIVSRLKHLQTGTGTVQIAATNTAAITAVIFSLVDRLMASSERDANLSAALYAGLSCLRCDGDHPPTEEICPSRWCAGRPPLPRQAGRRRG